MRSILVAVAASLLSLQAQSPALVLPEASPQARVAQTVGLTELEVTYHRPAVKGRAVWGGLVPYGQVWRAGANENTLVRVSSAVQVAGKPLPAGTYGLHMIPTAGPWTVIFSRQTHGWGSYSYDPKEDALRVALTPRAAEPIERLAYTFDDPTDQGVTLSLRWERVQLSIPITVDTRQVVVASLRDQLRGIPQFFPDGWRQAAAWCLRNGVNLEEALAWSDRSLSIQPTFAGYRTKAGLLEKQGDAAGAEVLRAKALAIATETEVNLAGYALLAQQKLDEALALFRRNVQAHPESWNAHDSLAEALALKGDRAAAAAEYHRALELVTAEDQRARIRSELAKLN